MLKTIIKIFLFCSGVYAQSYFYSYVDPCSQLSVANSYKVSQDGEDGFRVTFYNRTKFFTFEQVFDGELEKCADFNTVTSGALASISGAGLDDKDRLKSSYSADY